MSIRFGPNPSGWYFGPNGSLALQNVVGTGSIPLKLVASGDGYRKTTGTGEVTIPVIRLEVIAVHPVTKHGTGSIVLPRQGVSGAGVWGGRPFGTGSASVRVAVSGSGRRRPQATGDVTTKLVIVGIGSVNGGNTGTGATSFRIAISGEGTVKQNITGTGDVVGPKLLISGVGTVQRYITGTGEIVFRALSIKDVPTAVAIQVVEFEGAFVDPEFEGAFKDQIDFEGAG